MSEETYEMRIALKPKHPERVCWGCDRYCPTRDLACGNGSIRTPHPIELFGEDWQEWNAEQDLSDAPDPTLDVTENGDTLQRAV